MICQISRFDPWKDPLGVIDVYRMAKDGASRPAARDGRVHGARRPEGWEWYEKALRRAAVRTTTSKCCRISMVSATSRSTRSSAPRVSSSRSRRERASAWSCRRAVEGTPVVAGNVGGIPLQVHDGKSGFLVDSVEECGQRVLELLDNPALCERMGTVGREDVRDQFLITRYLHDYVRMFTQLAGTPAPATA